MRARFVTSFIITSLALGAFAGCSDGDGAPSFTTLPHAGVTAQRRSVASSASANSSRTFLFEDDFDNHSTAGWTTHDGSTWTVCQPPGSTLQFCTPGRSIDVQALATAGSPTWTDYEVDAWVAPGSATIGGVELIGRYVDEQHFYQLELHNLGGGQYWGISKLSGSTWTQLAGGPISYTAGNFYHLRFVVNGSTLSAYETAKPNDFSLASDHQLGSATDTSYAAGAIGVRAIDGIPAHFSDIDVVTLASPAPAPTQPPVANHLLTVTSGFYAEAIAHVAGAREIAAASNGDLLVGTTGTTIAVVPNAESDSIAGAAQTLVTLPEGPAEGIALGPNGTLYAGTNTSIWAIPYMPGTLTAPAATKIAAIRTGPVSPASDGDVHRSTSVIVSGGVLYAGIGSSCNACVEVDPTRATVQAFKLDGSGMHTYATRIRNPVGFTLNPATGTVFTGGAGQDYLPPGHPYEYLDALTSHSAVADYGWPACEENHVAYTAGTNCSQTVQPIIEFPAYSTIIGAAYYPSTPTGTYTFPAAFAGGIFVTLHGSWHANNGISIDPPHVAFVPMHGDTPAKPVNWNDPTAQWTDFFTGFQVPNGARIGRPSGIAVGARGSLFIADDETGMIYRIRPGVRPY
jgi:glucose/arabinose dehydrogenase